MENQQVEFITNWNCNLSCYGCDSYSHLIKQPKHNNYLLDDIKNWAIKLVPLSKNKDINCNKVKILGGEPFLYKKLNDILITTRQHYKEWNVVLGTNGLLLKKNKNILQTCADLNIELYITKHFKDKNYLTKLKENIYFASEYTNKIKIVDATRDNYWRRYNKQINNKIYPWNNKNIRKTWEACLARRCHQVYKSYLYKCSIIAGLENVLSETNQTNEKEWQKYLKYSPIHYTCSEEEIIKFFSKEEEYICSICNIRNISLKEKINNMKF